MQSVCEDLFSAVRSPNPLEETVDRIAGAIKARLLSPGDRLPAERELATQLCVSRSTLRVALQNLVVAGWLEVRRGRHGGSFVARWPAMPDPRCLTEVLIRHRTELPALLDYRCAVESAGAAFAAERASSEDLARLEQLAAATMRHAGNFEAFRAADTRFHIGVARAAYSPRLMQAVTEIQAAISEVLDVVIYHSNEMLEHSTADHWQIYDAIRIGDAQAARQLMLNHLNVAEQVIYGLLPEMLHEASRGL